MKENKFPKTENPEFLASYMAGLYEGDGCLTPRFKPLNKEEIRTYEFHFSFSKDDLKFATFLKDRFEIGQITEKKGEHSVVWSITSIGNVINLLSFINGYLRSPKIVTVWKALEFVNKKYNLNIPLKPLNTTPLLEDAWLTGFTDSDASFQISLSKKEPNTVSLTPFYALEVAEFYIKHEEEAFKDHKSNIIFMQPLADILQTSVEKVPRTTALKICASRLDNTQKLINYFNEYPLFSSKYYNYLDWVKVINLRNKAKSNKKPLITIYDKVAAIKTNYNSTRDYTILTWDHLKENFPLKPLNYPNHIIKLWKRKPSKDDCTP